MLYFIDMFFNYFGIFLLIMSSSFADIKTKSNLTEFQKKVMKDGYTEPAFDNAYWNNKKEGIYVDAESGIPLFSSQDKFDSGTGWPSFTKPINKANIVEKKDYSQGMQRVEVRSSSGSHLGHVFNDGPKDRGGERFCMNSAALRFISVDNLEKEGYGEYLKLFSKKEETAILAGGCFWGLEDLLRKLPGIIDTTVGYTGGKINNPDYQLVHTGTTDHAEAVKVVFDSSKISYESLLKYFFKIHNPTTLNKQGNDFGTQYRSAIFYFNEEQKEIAQKLIIKLNNMKIFDKPIATQVIKADKFYKAEDYHQRYLIKNPNGYTCHYIRDIDI